MGTVNCVELTKLAFVLVFVKVYPLLAKATCTFAPLTKFDPLRVNVCALLDPVTGLGLMLLNVGAGVDAGALTTKLICPLSCASGFCTRTFHVSAVVLVVIGTVNCVELTKLAFVLVFVNV
jgi:hypothetical protein